MRRLRPSPTELIEDGPVEVYVTLVGDPDRAVTDVLHVVDQWLVTELDRVRVHTRGPGEDTLNQPQPGVMLAYPAGMRLYLRPACAGCRRRSRTTSVRSLPLGSHRRAGTRRPAAGDGIRPAAILTSPLLRARETAAALGRELGCEPEPDERLAPGATAELVRAAAAGRGDEVVVVGHQPDCG